VNKLLLLVMALAVAGCPAVELSEGGTEGWANVPTPGVYEIRIESNTVDGCELAPVFIEMPLWSVTTRDSARDAFQLIQPELGYFVQCGYASPGYACYESDLGTWLTGTRDIAVWMDGENRSDGFAIDVQALETCADAGGCAEPCESSFTLHVAGPG